MKKIYSLLKACMTSDMNIFKIKQKKDKKSFLPIALSILFMFTIWSNANMIFEKVSPLHLQVVVISLVVLGTSLMTIIEGIYKTGPLLFNCKDDQLLLSLPIKRSTVLFVRLFKFYIFELIFNSLFIIPLIIAYLRWADTVEWTFYLTSFVMIILLPIIPVVISCIIGFITSSLSSRFKYKNLAQTVFAMLIIFIVFYFSYNMDNFLNYVAKHATSINDYIMKLYYPAGVYAKLVTDFNVIDLLIFIIVNIGLIIITLFVFSKLYFKINSRIKNISTSSKVKVDKLVIKSRSKNYSLIRKELGTFFNTPVFIVNAGFSLVLYLIIVIALCVKYEDTINILGQFSLKSLSNYLSIFILIILSFTAFMTSITSSVISLEGKRINILKSLPIKVKTILMSKVYAALIITTVPILIGDLILFIRFKFSIIEMILIIVLSIIIPLISHFIGLIINLKYPKLDYENSAEVVKQSISSFLSVLIGMLLLIGSIVLIIKLMDIINSITLLIIFLGIYLVIDIILYIYLVKVSVKDFDKLSV